MAEAIDSHITGWFWNAAARSRRAPGRAARVRLRAPGERRRGLEVHRDRRRPGEARGGRLDDARGRRRRGGGSRGARPAASSTPLRATVAELVPVEGRPVGPDDTVIVDLISPNGETRRDYVVELGRGARRRGDRARHPGHERRGDEGDRLRDRGRHEAVGHRHRQGDQGEGAPGDRRLAGARRDGVRDARRAARRTSSPACAARSTRRSRRSSEPTSPTRSWRVEGRRLRARSSRRARASCSAGSHARSSRAGSSSTPICR